MSPVSKGRRPKPRRSPRASPAAPFTRTVLEAFDNCLSDRGPLHAEVLLSQVLGAAWGQAEWGRTQAAAALATELVDSRPIGHRAGGLLLLSLARIGPQETRDSARRLLEYGLARDEVTWQIPAWADRIGQTMVRRGATLTDVYGDQTSYYLEFAYADEHNPEVHLLVILVDYNLHIIKDMFVAPGSDAFDFIARSSRNEEGTIFRDLEIAAAGSDIAHHLWLTDHTVGEVFGEHSAETRYLLGARIDPWLAETAESSDSPEVSAAQCDRIVTAFMNTAAVKHWLAGKTDGDPPPSRSTVKWITEIAIAYACDYGVGDPLRWSPIAVELFLTDWAPRKVNWQPDDLPWVPEVLDRLVAYCGKRKKLQARWIQETRDAVAEYAGDFVAIELAGVSKGPAAQLLADMLADGVDPMDESGVRRWIARYNEQR